MSAQPTRHRLFFPLLALGLSLLFLVFIEITLRLSGVAAFEPDPFVGFAGSHPFFIKVGSGDQARYTINPRHQQFFNQVSFPAKKAPGSFRVFAAGGSTALGFPFYEPGSFSRFLQIGLDRLDPDRPHQVINAGGFGYASYRVARVVDEVLDYQPDLVVVMTGHNEFLEKRVYGGRERQSNFLAAIRSALDRLRLYRLLRQTVRVLWPSSRPWLQEEVTWEKYSRDPEQAALTLDHYRYNLEKIARLCRERGVPLILMTLPSNLKDFWPYRSVHRADLNPGDLAEWDRHYRAGRNLIQEGKANLAQAEFEAAARLDEDFAALHFLLGKSLLLQGRREAAAREFWRAVRLDAWPVRAFPEMNQSVADWSGRGTMVADALARFAAEAGDHVPGNDLFLDHCHPTLPGQALLAEAVLEAMGQSQMTQLPKGWKEAYRAGAAGYQESLGQAFLGEAYYRVAAEVGINMDLPEPGLRLAEMADRLVPDHPQLPRLFELLRRRANRLENSSPP